MGPEVGPAFQRRSRPTLYFHTFRIFVTGGSKRPGNSGLRAAIRTAARARSGRANDMGGIRDVSVGEIPVSTLRTERERDREQVGHMRCWGAPGGGGGGGVCGSQVTRQSDLNHGERGQLPVNNSEFLRQNVSPARRRPLQGRTAAAGGGGGRRAAAAAAAVGSDWRGWFGLIWFGLVKFDLIWVGLVWFGLVWVGLGWAGLVWFGLNGLILCVISAKAGYHRCKARTPAPSRAGGPRTRRRTTPLFVVPPLVITTSISGAGRRSGERLQRDPRYEGSRCVETVFERSGKYPPPRGVGQPEPADGARRGARRRQMPIRTSRYEWAFALNPLQSNIGGVRRGGLHNELGRTTTSLPTRRRGSARTRAVVVEAPPRCRPLTPGGHRFHPLRAHQERANAPRQSAGPEAWGSLSGGTFRTENSFHHKWGEAPFGTSTCDTRLRERAAQAPGIEWMRPGSSLSFVLECACLVESPSFCERLEKRTTHTKFAGGCAGFCCTHEHSSGTHGA
eukprot:gene11026-biopygen7815